MSEEQKPWVDKITAEKNGVISTFVQCLICNTWYVDGTSHSCSVIGYTSYRLNDTGRIAAALERIATALEKIASERR